MILAVTSDQWIGFLTPLLVGWSIWYQQRVAHRNAVAADNAEKERREVKADLKDNTAKTEKIHKQLNGERGVMLKTIAGQAREIANLMCTPEKEALATAAEKLAKDHAEAQKQV